MASICQPSFHSIPNNPHKLNLTPFKFVSQSTKLSTHSPISLSKVSDSLLCCRCQNSNSNGGEASDTSGENTWRWDFDMQETFRSAIKKFDEYFNNTFRDSERVEVVEDVEWDWERWMKHFAEIDEHEKIVLVLKNQLANAIEMEDYEEAAKVKVAIAAAATNDTVGRVISHLKKSVEEERYKDAALIRDYAGAGLVGWWAGIPKDSGDPYGRIIHIRAEYGRYIARSYSPRQLTTASDGARLFEVYLTKNEGGKYKQQGVYLKRKAAPQDIYIPSFKSSTSTIDPGSRDTEDSKSKLFGRSSEETKGSEDKDDDSGLDNALQDMIPGVKVKVVKVTSPQKVDRDLISKVIEQIMDEEEEEEKDYDLETMDDEDDTNSANDEGEGESDIELSSSSTSEDDSETQIAVEVVLGDGFFPKIPRGMLSKDFLRIPARLEKKGRFSFTFTVEEEEANENIVGGDGQSRKNKRAKLFGPRSIDNVMIDLEKGIGKGKIPGKVLRDVRDLLNLTLSQSRTHEALSGSTTFNRIDLSSPSDPLNGVYIGSHGLHPSEVIQMKRRFGQWKEDESTEKPSKLEFYEYVEAVKLTGDPYVPAGQVAFRAKVGKQYQLPHKGIIPEEFGVIARYRGQGRIADSGFKNPRWVDGELVILAGKYIKGGPVVGFVYWAPEYHFLVFFNRLRLKD